MPTTVVTRTQQGTPSRVSAPTVDPASVEPASSLSVSDPLTASRHEVSQSTESPLRIDTSESALAAVERPADFSIVANTHAFLASSLVRPEMWRSPLVRGLVDDIAPQCLMRPKYKRTGNRTLPDVTAMLKDPEWCFDLTIALERSTKVGPWARDPKLFKGARRNRNERDRASRHAYRDQIGSKRLGPWPNGIVRMDSPKSGGRKLFRGTRDAHEAKGSDCFAPLKTAESVDYDRVDYAAAKAHGYAAVTDPYLVHFGGGTSGSVGAAVVSGTFLARRTIRARATALQNSILDSYDRSSSPSGVKAKLSHALQRRRKAKAVWKQCKSAATREIERELATAEIGRLVYEGHHALLETILPLEKGLGLYLQDQTPEQVLLRQVVPYRVRAILDRHLDTWIDEQFPAEQAALGGEVRRRIRTILNGRRPEIG